MKGNSAATKAIKAAVESKDHATVEAKAKDIMGTADKIVSLFPRGARPEKPKRNLKFGKNPMIFPRPRKT